MNAPAKDATALFVAPGLEDAPLNQWWVAASREEVGRAPLSRQILGRSVVLYRTEAGEVTALPDRCPHRFMPLSQGWLIGDRLRCAYHGFEFGPDGRCAHIPSQGVVPGTMRIRPYPVVEHGLWVWIWPGDPELADPALLPPDYSRPGYDSFVHFQASVKCHFLKLQENLLDSTHPTFLHEGMFDDGELANSPQKVEADERFIRLTRETQPQLPNEMTAQSFSLPRDQRAVRAVICEGHAPSRNVVITRFTFPDRPDAPPHELISELPVTPANGKLCYQWWASISSYPLRDTDGMTTIFRHAMNQDIVALELIEDRIAEGDPAAIEISVRADEAALRWRRMVRGMAQAGPAATAGATLRASEA